MKKRNLLTLLGSICLIVVIAAVPLVSACAAPAKHIELIYSTSLPASSASAVVAEHMFKQIEEATGGRVTIIRYTGGALGKAKEHYDIVLDGRADIIVLVPADFAGVFPLTEVVRLPFSGYSTAELATRIQWDLYNKFPEFRAEYADVKLLALWNFSPQQLFTGKKPVHNLADIEGMKIRSSGDVAANVLTLLGASPLNLPAPDVYGALDKGLVDGVTFGTPAAATFKFHEVVSYMTVLNYAVGSMTVVMNKDSWNALPGDIKATIDEFTGESGSVGAARREYDEKEEAGRKIFQEAGVEIYELPAEELAKWREAIAPIYDDWAKEMEAKGLPGSAFLDEALGLVEQYR